MASDRPGVVGVTGVLVVSGDAALRAVLGDCAARAGLHIVEHADLAAARPDWPGAGVVFLGADLGEAAVRAGLPPVRELTVVVAEDEHTPFPAAAALGAAYVALLPLARTWLIGRMRQLAAPMLDRLRAAGFTVCYADRAAAGETGLVHCRDVRAHADGEHPDVLVSFGDVARGECDYGQSSTVRRSNFRTLRRRFPGVFTDLVFANVTVLAAFATDLPPDAVDALCGLADEYAVLDEHELAEVESEEILASWGQYVADDVAAQLGERARAVWDVLDDDVREQLWWDTVTGTGDVPEHDGHAVRWDYRRLVPAYAARLLAEFRRGWRPDARYRVLEGFLGYSRPRYALLWDSGGEYLGCAPTRFGVRVLAWRHQSLRRAAVFGEVSPCRTTG